MLNILSNLIDKLFALPGFILAIIELKKFISHSNVKKNNCVQKQFPSTEPIHKVSSYDSNIIIENRKTVFTIYSYLSFILSIGYVIALIYFRHDIIPLIKNTDFPIPPILQILSSYCLFGCYKLSKLFIYILMGTSVFALTLQTIKNQKKSFIEIGIFLSLLLSSFILCSFAFPSNYEDIYKFLSVSIFDNKSAHDVMVNIVPILLIIEPFILLTSFIQISHMLYIPKDNSPYLKVRIKTTLSLFLVPLVLILSTSYWAFL